MAQSDIVVHLPETIPAEHHEEIERVAQSCPIHHILTLAPEVTLQLPAASLVGAFRRRSVTQSSMQRGSGLLKAAAHSGFVGVSDSSADRIGCVLRRFAGGLPLGVAAGQVRPVIVSSPSLLLKDASSLTCRGG